MNHNQYPRKKHADVYIQRRLLLPVYVLAVFLISGCSSTQVSDYRDNNPVFEPVWFDGDMTAHGIVKNRSGKVIRRFNVTMNGSWQQSEDGLNIGTLVEDFVFDDGGRQQRIWTFEQLSDKQYLASANDVEKPRLLKYAGNSLFLNYRLQVALKSRSIILNVEDRMYLINDRVLLNESVLTKWGFRVGDIQLVMLKS